jgi:hypothetical protein
MKQRDFETLVEALDNLRSEGYTAEFKAEEDCIMDLRSHKKYQPDQLVIQGSYRFEGQTNPADAVEVFAIKGPESALGTLVMSYGAKKSQNDDLIRQIPVDRS